MRYESTLSAVVDVAENTIENALATSMA